MSISCNVCKNKVNFVFEDIILNKYKIKFYKCSDCGFIQTEKPFWLSEAYSNVIASTDIGLLQRNLINLDFTSFLISNYFNCNSCYLDYAGGFGVFVRLMRDKGFNFYRQDVFCQNIFAKFFDIDDLSGTIDFELLTAFEVFEHLEDPISEIQKMFSYSNNILFSTNLQPSISLASVDDWWYFTPDTGQHISFYNLKSLEILAEQFQCYFYSNGLNLHIFSKQKLNSDPFIEFYKKTNSPLVFKLFNKLIKKLGFSSSSFSLNSSLLQSDYEFVKSKIIKI